MTKQNNNAQLAIRYFQCWANRDIASMEVLLADDVMLLDWSGPALGKDAFIADLKQLYASTKVISLDIKKIAIGQDTVMAELEIKLDRKKLFVVNVLDYNEEGKIQRIRAYKI